MLGIDRNRDQHHLFAQFAAQSIGQLRDLQCFRQTGPGQDVYMKLNSTSFPLSEESMTGRLC